MDQSLIYVVMLADVVFCLFNFCPKGKAKCFAGDVGSIGVAYILLFMIGSLVLATQDVTWLILLLVYGVDGVMTISIVVLAVAYVLFKRKYYHLHEEYLASLAK